LLTNLFYRLYVPFASAVQLPLILAAFLSPRSGHDYGVTLGQKLRLLGRLRRARRRVATATHLLEQTTMLGSLLRVPPKQRGCVVECGTFKGGSAIALSLACELTGRELHIFDSFAGLPAPKGSDAAHLLPATATVHTYTEGAFRGTREEVEANLERWGAKPVCRLHEGFFAVSLPAFRERCVMAFLDVDLVDSLKTCLRYLWPLLEDGAVLFTHEAPHMEIAKVFFDDRWWQDVLGIAAPGLIGAGSGLGLVASIGHSRSDLGYAIKNPNRAAYEVVPQRGNP